MLMVRSLGSGGTERQAAEIAKALDPARFRAHVACFVDGGFRADELRRRQIPVLVLPVRSYLSRGAARAAVELRRYARRHGIQLVHTFDFPLNIFGVPTARAIGVPVVLSSQRSYRELVPPKYKVLLRLTDYLVDGIVVNCRAVERHLQNDYSIPKRKLHLCHNGIDTAIFHPGGRERMPQLAGAPLVIGTVAVLRPEKGLHTLIEAFAQVHALVPGSRLVVVGSGPEQGALLAASRSRGIAEAVLFQAETADVASWLRAMDIFVLPSLSEALSNSLMEAMACGCCAIASDVGGNPELITHGVTGLLFDRTNPIALSAQLRAVIEDAVLRRRLAQAGAERIRTEFAMAQSAHRIQQIYESFLVPRGIRNSVEV